MQSLSWVLDYDLKDYAYVLLPFCCCLVAVTWLGSSTGSSATGVFAAVVRTQQLDATADGKAHWTSLV
jgi:hypothetical protein